MLLAVYFLDCNFYMKHVGISQLRNHFHHRKKLNLPKYLRKCFICHMSKNYSNDYLQIIFLAPKL